jgi:RNA polymerase sigma factor (sigma-70 family)
MRRDSDDDPDAPFRAFHALRWQRAWRHIRWNVRGPADADDVFQTVFSGLCLDARGAPDLLTDQELHKRIKSELRAYGRARKASKIDDGADADRVPTSKPNPEQALHGCQDDAGKKRMVDATLAEMPEDEVMLFQLSRDGELPYERIAAIVECSVDTVKVRIHRVRAKFRKLMERRYDLSRGSGGDRGRP